MANIAESNTQLARYAISYVANIPTEVEYWDEASTQIVRALERILDEVIVSQEMTFKSMLLGLDLTNTNYCDVLIDVVREVTSDGLHTWGRLATIHAFSGYFLKYSLQRGFGSPEQLVEAIANAVGSYIDEEWQQWIQDNGGLDEFAVFFIPRRPSLARETGQSLSSLLLRGINIFSTATSVR